MSRMNNEQDKNIICDEKFDKINGGKGANPVLEEPEMIEDDIEQTLVKNSAGDLYKTGVIVKTP